MPSLDDLMVLFPRYRMAAQAARMMRAGPTNGEEEETNLEERSADAWAGWDRELRLQKFAEEDEALAARERSAKDYGDQQSALYGGDGMTMLWHGPDERPWPFDRRRQPHPVLHPDQSWHPWSPGRRIR